jgi:hypothetical protein
MHAGGVPGRLDYSSAAARQRTQDVYSANTAKFTQGRECIVVRQQLDM